MGISKYILKNTRRQAAAKVVSDAVNNITITYTDIKYADQTIPLTTAGNLTWTISDIVYDVASYANIVRNGKDMVIISAIVLLDQGNGFDPPKWPYFCLIN